MQVAEELDIQTFLNMPGVILDVRSAAEYSQGHIPNAYHLPIFTDAERAEIGTLYKNQGRSAAIEKGLKIVGPKLSELVFRAKNIVKDQTAKVHCWRGGMRSACFAWLLRIAGLKTMTLKGGYKVFRRWALNQFDQKCSLIVIGGFTGSGKTSILHTLTGLGEQVLDLESFARHRGSSYGCLKKNFQPTTEQFENEIAIQWALFDRKRPVWIEDESRMIGLCNIPNSLFAQMRSSPLLIIERPFEERLLKLIQEYGQRDSDELIEATQRISKKLGSFATQEAVKAIQEGFLKKALEIILKYYDNAYLKGIKERTQTIFRFQGDGLSSQDWAKRLLSHLQF